MRLSFAAIRNVGKIFEAGYSGGTCPSKTVNSVQLQLSERGVTVRPCFVEQRILPIALPRSPSPQNIVHNCFKSQSSRRESQIGEHHNGTGGYADAHLGGHKPCVPACLPQDLVDDSVAALPVKHVGEDHNLLWGKFYAFGFHNDDRMSPSDKGAKACPRHSSTYPQRITHI